VDDAERLASSERCHVVAPAGCGKTELVARSLNFTKGRTLVLTHTHAGVGALRQRFMSLRIPTNSYHLDTIASWALKYAAGFPATSGLQQELPIDDSDWRSVYTAACSVLPHSFARKIIKATYSGVLVDEYQDCTPQQHLLVLKLADVLPCRIVGDPLQGIFAFREQLVDWDSQVRPYFPELKYAYSAWRWQKSPNLGNWLLRVRGWLEAGDPIDLAAAPKEVEWRPLPEKEERFEREEVVVAQGKKKVLTAWDEQHKVLWGLKASVDCFAIMQLESPRHRLAKCTPFVPIESFGCKDLHDAALAAASEDPTARIFGLVRLLDRSFTKLTGLLRVAETVLKGASPSKNMNPDFVSALTAVADSGNSACILASLQRIMAHGNCYRPELMEEFLRALRAHSAGHFNSLTEAAWHMRDRTRHVGRRLNARSLGSTWLVKGLQCRTCIVLDAETLDAHNLYVALTRASDRLNILSRERVLSTIPLSSKAASTGRKR
jgi:hypothetical protein